MRFVIDGNEIVGKSYTDVVKAMSEQKFIPARTLARFRKATAKRVREMFGKEIDTTSDESFVKSLVEAGLVEKVQ